MEPPRVFISMGTPYTEDYLAFRNELETLLRDSCGVNPRIIGKNEYPSGSPLTHIREVMGKCHGVVVVAYERTYIENGTEKRHGTAPKEINKRTYTTPWNHIESAIAFNLGLPIYILCERGLTEEGLIESKVDWYVQYTDLVPGAMSKPDVSESIRSWINTRVIPRAKKPRFLQALLGGLKLSEMTPKEMITVISTLAATFMLGAGAAAYFPKIFALGLGH